MNTDSEENLTPVVLAQHILSISNLERFFDALIERPILIQNGCNFLHNVLDLLNRCMSAPLCIPLIPNDNTNSLNKDENDRMQVKYYDQLIY